MSDSLDWLPSDLHPVAMRIARADECAYAMGELASQWSIAAPLDLVQIRIGDRVRVRVQGIRPIPPRIPLLFSEAVNHLRAALDNVVWHLAEVTHGPLTGSVARLVNLPIYDSQEDLDKWVRRRVRDGLTAFESTAPLGQRVRELQPFVDQDSAIPSMRADLAPLMDTEVEVAHPLKLLQAYSNDDKHRTIRVALPRTSGGRTDRRSAQSRRFVGLEVGDVVAEGAWGRPVEMEQTTSIQIERPEPFTALVPPGQEVSRLASYVANVAVPQLVAGTAMPGSLPMKVDLDDSGLAVVDRLAAGDREPARERLLPLMTARFFEAMSRPLQYLPVVQEDESST